MEKKYQVFVSSTYEDLQEERKKSNGGTFANELLSCRNGVF